MLWDKKCVHHSVRVFLLETCGREGDLVPVGQKVRASVGSSPSDKIDVFRSVAAGQNRELLLKESQCWTDLSCIVPDKSGVHRCLYFWT